MNITDSGQKTLINANNTMSVGEVVRGGAVGRGGVGEEEEEEE